MLTTVAGRGLSLRRFVPLLILAAAGISFALLGGERYLTLSTLAQNRELLHDRVAALGAAAPFCFMASYAGLTALSIPGAALLSIAAGALFGLWSGTLYAVTGATIGATAVFAAARAGFGNVAQRAGPWAARLEAGFRADAFSYLLALRLVPLFPFWLVNLAAALTRVPFHTYVGATFFGIIPGCFVFVGVGGAIGDMIGAGEAPDPNAMFRSSVLLPIFGLAALALMPAICRRYRPRR